MEEEAGLFLISSSITIFTSSSLLEDCLGRAWETGISKRAFWAFFHLQRRTALGRLGASLLGWRRLPASCLACRGSPPCRDSPHCQNLLRLDIEDGQVGGQPKQEGEDEGKEDEVADGHDDRQQALGGEVQLLSVDAVLLLQPSKLVRHEGVGAF